VSWTCTEQRNRKKTRFRELKDQIAAKGKGGDNGFKRAAGLWCQFVPSGSATVGLFSSACLDSHVPFWAQAKAQTLPRASRLFMVGSSSLAQPALVSPLATVIYKMPLARLRSLFAVCFVLVTDIYYYLSLHVLSRRPFPRHARSLPSAPVLHPGTAGVSWLCRSSRSLATITGLP
jgi:hypothetical protein